MNRSFALEDVCKTRITEQMIKFVSAKAASVIQCSPPASKILLERAVTPPPTPNSHGTSSYSNATSSCPRNSKGHNTQVPPLPTFISTVVERSRAQMPTLLSALVYLDRLQRSLPKAAKGLPCTCHRVFLAALILAAKYTNDSSPKNSHWARYSCVFSLAEVNLMEKQLLFLLDFDLQIQESQLIAQIQHFFSQDIDHPAMTKPPLPDLSTTFADTTPVHPKQTQPVTEPHHRPPPNPPTFSDFPQIPSSLYGTLQIPNRAVLRYKNDASFYPSPSQTGTVDGGFRRSSISEANTIDIHPALINADGTVYCYRDYQNVVHSCVTVVHCRNYYPHHVPTQSLSGGAIC